MSTPMFVTHHAPCGAWSSLTFGLPGKGVSIDHERGKVGVGEDADLLVAVCRGERIGALPFVREGAGLAGYSLVEAGAVVRTLTPCVDEYAAAGEGLVLRVYTPSVGLPNPRRSGSLQFATVPGILVEVEIDNTGSEVAARGFLGLSCRGMEGMRPVDWTSKALCGVAMGGRWLLGAHGARDEVYTVRDERVAGHLRSGKAVVRNVGSEGGIAFEVPAGTKRTLTAVLAFGHGGAATQGIDTGYMFARYFPKLETAANFLLQNAGKVREGCVGFDRRCAGACADSRKVELFAQGLRAYQANTQITEAEGNVYFTVIAGEAGWRNDLNGAVDHLAWELERNPWVVRNIFDLYTSVYAYQDQVVFGEVGAEGAEVREGGMGLARDMGSFGAYAPAGQSGSELAGEAGGLAYATTEQILNGIYLLTSYALAADDGPWSRTRLPFARELMMSLENRDDWEAEKRDGIPKGRSTRCGGGEELGRGSLGMVLKTFAANLMLTTYFQGHNDLHSADYSYAFAQKTAQSLVGAFDAGAGMLPGNLLSRDTSAGAARVLAGLEALAAPTHLGVTSTLAEYFPELFGVLKQHAETCLKACVDPVTGGLRLSSDCGVVRASAVISVVYVLERLFGIDVEGQYPTVWRELVQGVQGAGTASEPGLIAAALFMRGTTTT